MSEPNLEQQLEEAETRRLDEEKLIEAGQKKILKSQLQDPWASKPLLLRMVLGAFITISIMLAFAYVGDFLLGDTGSSLGIFIGFCLGLWLPPHLNEYN